VRATSDGSAEAVEQLGPAARPPRLSYREPNFAEWVTDMPFALGVDGPPGGRVERRSTSGREEVDFVAVTGCLDAISPADPARRTAPSLSARLGSIDTATRFPWRRREARPVVLAGFHGRLGDRKGGRWSGFGAPVRGETVRGDHVDCAGVLGERHAPASMRGFVPLSPARARRPMRASRRRGLSARMASSTGGSGSPRDGRNGYRIRRGMMVRLRSCLPN